jgi:outer membrane protein
MTLKTLSISGLSFVALVASAVVASPSVGFADDAVKIGVVDMQKALQTVDAGKKARAQLEKEFNSKKTELQNEEAAIKKLGAEFQKQSLVLSDEAQGKKRAELQERIAKLQEKTARSQGDIQQKEHELTQPILDKLRSIIGDLAKQKGYTIILEKNDNTVLYSLEKDDLTHDVIVAYDKQASSKAELTKSQPSQSSQASQPSQTSETAPAT